MSAHRLWRTLWLGARHAWQGGALLLSCRRGETSVKTACFQRRFPAQGRQLNGGGQKASGPCGEFHHRRRLSLFKRRRVGVVSSLCFGLVQSKHLFAVGHFATLCALKRKEITWIFVLRWISLLNDPSLLPCLPLQDASSAASNVWAGCPMPPWWPPSSASQAWRCSAAAATWRWPVPWPCWRTTSPGSPATTPPSPWCKLPEKQLVCARN